MLHRTWHRMVRWLLLRTLVSLVLPCLASAALALGALSGGVVENRGQIADAVRFYADCGDATVYFTATGVMLDLPQRRHAICMRFVGASPSAVLEPRGERRTRVHVFTGSDAARWRSGLCVYSELLYRDLWPGIDVLVRPEDGQLRYRILAAAGADRRQAAVGFEGIDRATKSAGDTLRLQITGASLVDLPAAPGDGTERILRWGAARGAAPAGDLPSALFWGTFLGGGDNDYAHGLALDAADRPVVCGYALSIDFPATPGAYDSTHAGGYDAFVAKLDATGSALLWATFLGGGLEDRPFAVAVDRADGVIVAGHTYSADFPTTAGVHDRVLDGPRDAFVAKLDSSGSLLLWSTYLGGTLWERAWGLALDAADRPVVAGETRSVDFPTTAGAFDTTLAGAEAFVTKLDALAETLEWSTLLGGSSSDWVRAVALDALQRPVVVGVTYSHDFPTTPGSWDRTFNGVWDAFVTRLAADGRSVAGSTYLGGAEADVAYAVDLNDRDDAVVVGSTSSADFPATVGVFDVSYNGAGDIFVAELDSAATGLSWCTFVGGSGTDEGFAVTVDREGRPIVSGETASPDFPTTWHGDDRSYGGNLDAFVTQLAASGDAVTWSTFLGGGEWDSGFDFALDTAGQPVLTGPTRSGDFPTTPGAYDRSYNGGAEDAFLVRFVIPRVAAAERGEPRLAELGLEPNPFHDSVLIRFRLAHPGPVRLLVVDAAGRSVATFDRGTQPAGAHSFVWKGQDERGNRVASGVYWLQLETAGRPVYAKSVHVR